MKLKAKMKLKFWGKYEIKAAQPTGYKFRVFIDAIHVIVDQKGKNYVGLSYHIHCPQIPIFKRMGDLMANDFRVRLGNRFFASFN